MVAQLQRLPFLLSGGKKGKQLKCGGGIVKPYGEKNVHFGVKAPNLAS